MAYKMLDGNGAAVEAIQMAGIQVIAAYPITPQSSISEKLSELVADGTMDAQYIRVESEHSAMSAALAAQMTGVRAATATSSNGLALMHEVICMVSGNRQPIVMPVVNRAIAAPWSLWCDHSDAMFERDTGWLQIYCQNVQEVFDLMMVAYRVAEHEHVLLPAMVCLDGFFLSHSMQKIDVPTQDKIDTYLEPYAPKNLVLNPEDPLFICDLTGAEDFTEVKYQQKIALDNAADVLTTEMNAYNRAFDRNLSVAEGFMTEGAQAILLSMGSMSGTAKQVVKDLRAQGKQVGLINLTVYRPFPADKLRTLIPSGAVVGVFDRSSGYGSLGGPVWNELCAAMRGEDCDIRSYIGGLGGRDVSTMTIERIFSELLDIASGQSDTHTQWIDLKGNPMGIREVQSPC